MPIQSKLPRVGTTIFTVMSRLAQECQAINLSQGFPDFDCPEGLLERIQYYMRNGFNQYSPMSGIPKLRQAIAQKVERSYHTPVDPEEEINVFSGASEALFCGVAALIHPGDEVIILEPAYDLYGPVIELFGGVPVPVPLSHPTYLPDWDLVQAKLTPQTQMIIVNSPHNPSGSCFREEDWLRLEKIAQQHDLWVLSDEVYEHIFFEGARPRSLWQYPGLRERGVAVFSFGKTFHITGWKIGYALAPAPIMHEIRKIHQFNTFATFTPAQHALADFLQDPENYEYLGAFFQKRRDYFQDLMADTPFELIPSYGTYFQMASFAHLSPENDLDYAQRITREVGVATIPVSSFYTQGSERQVIRFCFAKNYQTLDAAAERLREKKELLYQTS